MKEWLLKDDDKYKVGRPKLADNSALKRARISIGISLCLCFILFLSFVGTIKKISPVKLAYSITFEKMFGALENKNGFITKESYDKNDNYVMEIKTSDKVDSYQGSYKYTLYRLVNNEWKEYKSKQIKKGTKSFKVRVKSLKNKNVTWKIKLQITNASYIDKSYAPGGWQFTDSDDATQKYASYIFTVKGYYSPVTLNEIKEAKKSTNKITIETKKGSPRTFILKTPEEVKVQVTYTDSSKKIKLKTKTVATTSEFKIPNLSRLSQVTFKVYGNNLDTKKLSNWTLSDDNTYITNTYLLKPENAYKD